MAKGEITRQGILDKAAGLAAVRGLAGVSLGDVADAAGMSKSGVFKHFNAKEALQQALVESVSARFVDRVWRPAAELPRGRARLDAIFARWLDWVVGEENSGGCGLLAFAIELDDQPGPLRDFLKGQQRLWDETLSRQFAHLHAPPIDPAAASQCAFEMKSIVLGYNHSRRLLDDEQALGMARAAFGRLLHRCASR